MSMDIGISARLRPILDEVRGFIDSEILPLEHEFLAGIDTGDRWAFTPRQIEILEGLKTRARSRGLWNFFLTEHDGGHGLTTVEYAYIAEETGKSHLATAFGMAACAQGKRVRFFRVTELITQLLEAKEERQLQRYRQAISKLDLLVLDELGYVPASKAGAELLFDVIATAYERYSLIVTTNLPFENWTEVLGSERLTGAALDRLTHRCHILETKGESYRLQDAKRRRKPG